MVHDLDDVDRGILHALQAGARGATAADMGEQVGTSASTVRNRIDQLEDDVILGYHPEIDYEAAGFELHLLVVCRAPTVRRSELARAVLGLPSVVSVRELATGTDNLHVEVVASDSTAADAARAGIEDLEDLDIVSTQVVNTVHLQPFDHFGAVRCRDETTADGSS